jgi:ankyrin repeat protein
MKHILITTIAAVVLVGCGHKTLPLHNAIRAKDIGTVEQLLNDGVNVNAKENDTAALNLAMLFDNKELVELLISSGADVNTKDDFGTTPLHRAARFDKSVLAELLILNGADVNAKTEVGATPLHLAAQAGSKNILKSLISNRADVNARDNSGYTPLSISLNHEIAELILNSGGKPMEELSIHLAAQNGNHEAVKKLFADGVDISMRDTMGLTPLDYANLGILEHGISVRDFILENGGKTGDWFRVDESIQIAVEVGNVEAVKKHLDAGAEVNGKDKLFGHTLLHQAASGGNTEIVEMLLTAGADVNATEGIQGGTPLHSASTKEVAELLIAQGADVNIKNAFFETPIDHAEGDTIGLLRKHGGKSGAEDSIHVAAGVGDMKLLMQHIKDGTSVDNKGPIGRTPLHFAAMNAHTEIADYLISNKVNINLEDDRGLTALGIAEVMVEMDMGDKRRVKMADLLRKHGGKTAKELKAEVK